MNMNNTKLGLILASIAAYARADHHQEESLNLFPFLNKEVPPIPGVAQNGFKKKIILAQDIDYPPFSMLASPAETGEDYALSGMAIDVIEGMNRMCPHLDIVPVQTDWNNCWATNEIGDGLLNGHYHGCMAYTHTKGVRNRYLEFSEPITQNGAAGILTRLEEGVPVVNSYSDLSGVKVADISGWAPTSDGLEFVENDCTGERFKDYEMLETCESYVWMGYENGSDELKEITLTNVNDIGLAMLLDGTVDAVWLYADQAARYQCSDDPDAIHDFNCDLWSRFGSEFAYVQTGMFDHANNGTTISISKKGSGLAEIINPCLTAFMKTRQYQAICEKYDMVESCIGLDEEYEEKPWRIPTSELPDSGYSCSDGYCSCIA